MAYQLIREAADNAVSLCLHDDIHEQTVQSRPVVVPIIRYAGADSFLPRYFIADK